MTSLVVVVVVVVVLQDFLVIVMLSMSIFVSCSSGATTCKCLKEEDATTAPTEVRLSVSNLHSGPLILQSVTHCYVTQILSRIIFCRHRMDLTTFLSVEFTAHALA